MPFRNYSPGAGLFALVAAGVMSLFPSRIKKNHSYDTTADPEEEVRNQNLAAMKKIVAEHEDCTAEVIEINVFGRRKVNTFRLLSPGRKVELLMKKGDIKVFAYGEYIAELIPPAGSRLPQLFHENIPFDAYLGGRDLVFSDSDTYDLCSIIVFYKIEGIQPTEVNLR